MTPRVPRASLLRPAALVLLLGALTLLAVVVDLPSSAELRSGMERAGWPGALAFVAVYAGATLLPLPKNVFSIAAGAAFGLATAVGLVLVGACVGACVAFGIARVLGRDAVARFTGGRLDRVEDVLHRHGFLAVLGLRLVPLVPFTALNYAAGLTSVRWLSYLVATALGIAPGTVALVAVGAYGTTPGSVPFVAAVVGLVALSGAGVMAARRWRRSSPVEEGS